VAQARTDPWNTTMKTIIERDFLLITLLFVVVVLAIFLGIGLELAYLGGVFTGKDEVIANDKRIENQSSVTKSAH
jgi:hypothetical protein